jgi:hypothetical protein
MWLVLEDWFVAEVDASIVMVGQDANMPGRQPVKNLGTSPVDLVEHYGAVLAKRQP